MDRYACLSDLEKYFKKKDLLGGLTETEQEQVRNNIGVINNVSEGGQVIPEKILYINLYERIKNKTLVTGARYKITDYQTIYSSNVFNSSGQRITWGDAINPSPVWNMIVTAIDVDKIDPRVCIQELPKYTVIYDITKQTLEDGVENKGTILYMEDLKGNSAYYDFKSIKFRRTSEEFTPSGISFNGPYIDFYTFSDIINGQVVDSTELYNTKYNQLQNGCYDNVFLGDTYNNVIQSGSSKNSFYRGCNNTTIGWDSMDNNFYEKVCYLNGSLSNKNISLGNTIVASSISKEIHRVNDVTILTYLDPTTYAYQIVIL